MELSKRITAIVYLDRDNFIYIDCTTGGLFQYQYTPEVISDLEVINEELLADHIASLIQENNIVPTQFVIILAASLLFEKKIPASGEQGEQNDVIQKFVDTVPFESVSFTKFIMEDGIAILAANTYFFEAIKRVFEKQGFAVSTVLPVYVLQEDITGGINVDSGKRILGKIDSVKQYNLLQQQQVILPSEKKQKNVSVKKSTNHMYILIGVFAVLVIILIVMVVLQK